MSELTCRALCYRGACCLSNVGVYLPSTVLQGCRLFKKCLNLPARHCVTVVKAVLAMSESTCQALWYSEADFLNSVGTYLPAIVLQWCRLLKRCQNLPTGHCVTVMQAFYAVSEPSCRALYYSYEGCLSNVGVYLPDTVLQGCRLFKWCRNLPGTVLQ